MITKADLNYDLNHQYSGNGWGIVEMIDKDNCRVASLGKDDVGERSFLAWTKLLKRASYQKPKVNPMDPKEQPVYEERPITGPLLEAITEVRKKLASGKWEFKETRLVEKP